MVHISVNGRPIISRNGKFSGVVLGMHDITDVVENQRALQHSESAFRSIFENAGAGMATIDPDGVFLSANNRLLDFFGYTQEELFNKTFKELSHPDDYKQYMEHLSELRAGRVEQYQMEKRFFHKSGDVKFALVAVSAIYKDDGNVSYYICQIIDISRVRKAEKSLSQADSSINALLNASKGIGFVKTDPQGVITTFNQGVENITGFNSKDIIGKQTPNFLFKADELLERASSPDLNGVVDAFAILRHLSYSDRFEGTEWQLNCSDKTITRVLINISPILVDDNFEGLLLVITHVEALKLAEEQLSDLLVMSSQQNNRLKNFAYIVSHNLRSHSGNIHSLVNFLKDDYPSLIESDVFDHLVKASDRLMDTVGHLGEVSNLHVNGDLELVPLSLDETVVHAVDSVSQTIKNSGVEVINEVNPQHCVLGVPAYLDSIVLNMLTNAIKYSSPDRMSFVKLSSKVEGDFVILEIEDNGLGMNLDKHRSELFKMFKTFHNHPDSRGLGLFLTHNHIEAIGGSIDVSSAIDVGTTFKIKLKNGK